LGLIVVFSSGTARNVELAQRAVVVPREGVLVSKQGGYRMGGYTTYAKNKRYRKYRVTKFCHAPTRNPILQRRVPAGPLESAVLNALSQILSAMPNQQARLTTAIHIIDAVLLP